MYSGFLGKQKILRVRAPIKLSKRIEKLTMNGSKTSAITRAIIELGLEQAETMKRADFMELVHEFKNKYSKEN